MENNTEKVTEPVIDEITKTEEPKTYTQEDLNNLISKESKRAIEKTLKDLGVEDVKSAKEGIAKAKEIQKAQKTDLQKAIERAEKAEGLITGYETEKKDRTANDKIKEILKSKEIDTKYAKTIKKLIGNVDEISEELVLNTINDELPILVSNTQLKVGIEKSSEEDLPKSGSIYLDAFKKMKR